MLVATPTPPDAGQQAGEAIGEAAGLLVAAMLDVVVWVVPLGMVLLVARSMFLWAMGRNPADDFRGTVMVRVYGARAKYHQGRANGIEAGRFYSSTSRDQRAAAQHRSRQGYGWDKNYRGQQVRFTSNGKAVYRHGNRGRAFTAGNTAGYGSRYKTGQRGGYSKRYVRR